MEAASPSASRCGATPRALSAPIQATQSSIPSPVEAPLAMLVPVWILVLANIYFGIDTELSTTAARLAAETLIGGWR